MKLKDKGLLKTQLFYQGQWQEGDGSYSVTNPANMQPITRVSAAAERQTMLAIESAEQGLVGWRKLTAIARSELLQAWADLMLSHKDDLATIMVSEQGKPKAEALGEVVYAASFLSWFAAEGQRAYGDIIPSFKPDARILVTKQPVGVVAAITPWNFPLAMITRKAGPALAAGCSIVIKPSELTPLSAAALVELALRAGIPAGVVNLVSGDAVAIGKTLMESSKVRKISFTGSTKVGKLLMAQAAPTLKKLSLELGGNAPFIVFDDADIDKAVAGAIASKFRNSGQTCVCVNRFLVQDAIYDEFTAKFAQAIQGLKVGDGFSEGVTQGPLINHDALTKVKRHIEDAITKGGRVLTGGDRHALGGTFYQPTLITEANDKMLLAKEETFGPVAACFRFRTEAEAINLANNTQFGLAAYFYTRDIGRVWRVAEALESGIVGINEGIISTAVAPFGGIKESGVGREGSKYGLDDYLEVKYMLMGGLDDE